MWIFFGMGGREQRCLMYPGSTWRACEPRTGVCALSMHAPATPRGCFLFSFLQNVSTNQDACPSPHRPPKTSHTGSGDGFDATGFERVLICQIQNTEESWVEGAPETSAAAPASSGIWPARARSHSLRPTH
eukprot:2004870-Prymnesium_polylepis.1